MFSSSGIDFSIKKPFLHFPIICLAASSAFFQAQDVESATIQMMNAPSGVNEYQGSFSVDVTMNFDPISDYGGNCTVEVDITDTLPTQPRAIATFGTAASNDFTILNPILVFDIPDLNTVPGSSVTSTLQLNIANDLVPENIETIDLFYNTPRTTSGNCGSINFPQGPTLLGNSISIYDNYYQGPSTITGTVPPGATFTETFQVTYNSTFSSLAISSNLRSQEGPVVITPATLPTTEGTQTVDVTYQYFAPPGDVGNITINDTLRIEPPIGAEVQVAGIDIPVSINVVSDVSGKVSRQSFFTAWDTLCQNPPAALAQACLVAGDALTEEMIRNLMPEEYGAMADGMTTSMKNHIKVIAEQQHIRRAGIKGIDLNRVAIKFDDYIVPFAPIIAGLQAEATGGAAGDNQAKWSFFASGTINASDKDSSTFDDGYKQDTKGMTLGTDYQLSTSSFIGGALGLGATDSNFGRNGGDLEIATNNLTVYGSYFLPSNLYFDWSTSLGKNNFDTKRNISSILPAAVTTTGSTDGNQFAVSLSGGMDLFVKKLQMSPYVRLDYIKNSIDQFQETGGSGLALIIEKQDITSTTTAFGGRFAYTSSQSWGVLTPTAHAEWVHEYNDDERVITARFASSPTVPFSTPVDSPDNNYFNWGLGLTATFPQGRVIFTSLEVATSQDNFTSRVFNVGGRIDF